MVWLFPSKLGCQGHNLPNYPVTMRIVVWLLSGGISVFNWRENLSKRVGNTKYVLKFPSDFKVNDFVMFVWHKTVSIDCVTNPVSITWWIYAWTYAVVHNMCKYKNISFWNTLRMFLLVSNNNIETRHVTRKSLVGIECWETKLVELFLATWRMYLPLYQRW